MVSDEEILETYMLLKKTVLPELFAIHDFEKTQLARVGWFNKKKIHKEIFEEYFKYRTLVVFTWRRIYSSEAEYSVVQSKHQVMLDGKPALPTETKLGHGVEQLFFFLDAAITSVMCYYEGKISKSTSNKIHLVAINGAKDIMDNIDRLYNIK